MLRPNKVNKKPKLLLDGRLMRQINLSERSRSSNEIRCPMDPSLNDETPHAIFHVFDLEMPTSRSICCGFRKSDIDLPIGVS